MAAPGNRQQRHTHPQRFAGRGRAVVGERVEGNIDLIVQAKVPLVFSDPAAEIETFRTNAMRSEQMFEILARLLLRQRLGFEQQTRSGHRVQHSGPYSDRRR